MNNINKCHLQWHISVLCSTQLYPIAFNFYVLCCNTKNLRFDILSEKSSMIISDFLKCFRDFYLKPECKSTILFSSNKIHILVITMHYFLNRVIFNAWSLYSIHGQINNSKCTVTRLLPFDNVFQKQVDVKVNITCRLYQMVSTPNCLGFVEWNS